MKQIENKEKFSMCSQLCKPHESNKMLWKIKQNLHNKIIEDLKSQSENNKETITHKNFI